MTRLPWIELTLLFIVVTGVRCLRDTRLEVQPEVVERGGEAVLRCHYVLENELLYILKWYRGKREFYRFVPDGKPTMKSFLIDGIEVDRQKSNESQVTIRNVDYGVTGNYSCEVTTDVTFTTEVGRNKIVVVSLPQGRPVIATERERYEPGETLRANCTVPPSKPPATLYFKLNNVEVGQRRTSQQEQRSNHGSNEGLKVGPDSYNVHQQEHHRRFGNLQWNELSLTLQPSNYTNGQLTLRCIAEIPGIYNATADMQLGTGLREPVPERVTSENSQAVPIVFSLSLLSLVIVHPLLR